MARCRTGCPQLPLPTLASTTPTTCQLPLPCQTDADPLLSFARHATCCQPLPASLPPCAVCHRAPCASLLPTRARPVEPNPWPNFPKSLRTSCFAKSMPASREFWSSTPDRATEQASAGRQQRQLQRGPWKAGAASGGAAPKHDLRHGQDGARRKRGGGSGQWTIGIEPCRWRWLPRAA